MAKKTKKTQSILEHSTAVQLALIWLIVGLMMALGGFIWATYTDSSPDVTGESVGSNLLSVFGLIIAIASLLFTAAIIWTTSVKTRKNRKKK